VLPISSRRAQPLGHPIVRLACLVLLLGLGQPLPCQADRQDGPTSRENAPPKRLAPDAESVLGTCIAEAHAAHEAPGLSAAAVLPDGTLVAVAVGRAHVPDGRALTPRDKMLSGSIGKSYVAAVALRLVADETLDLDARVVDLLDAEWTRRLPNAETVTPRHLLRHTSGIPDHVWREDFGRAVLTEPDRVWTAEERCAYVLDADPLFAPGEGFAYADTNYIVLGAVIERVSGEEIETLQRSLLFEPLGLADTLCADRADLAGLVEGHCSGVVFLEGPSVDGNGRLRINPQVEWCGGGIASTAGDLARFGRALFSGAVFAEEHRERSLALLLDTVPTDSPRLPGRYGAGVHVRAHAELGEVRGHAGIMTGYLSELADYPELGLTVALMWNTDDPRATGPRAGLADELARRLRDAGLAQRPTAHDDR
jgi:D-alanyl-D-alanine carboxypeptidase